MNEKLSMVHMKSDLSWSEATRLVTNNNEKSIINLKPVVGNAQRYENFILYTFNHKYHLIKYYACTGIVYQMMAFVNNRTESKITIKENQRSD